jgi:uncharacterized membrane protein YhaH (DUF805 family)
MFVADEFFTFEGRLDRLGYLWRCAALLFVLAGLESVGRNMLVVLLGEHGLFGVRTWTEWATAAVLLLAAWAALALSSRRLRDMGAEPAWVVPLYGFLCSVGIGLGEPMLRLAPAPFDSAEAVAMMMPSLAAVPLIIWPGRRSAMPKARSDYQSAAHTAYVDWRSASGEASNADS